MINEESFAEVFGTTVPVDELYMPDLEQLVEKWHMDKGLLDVDINAQVAALGEEFGELCHAIAKGTRDDRVDAIGDMMVVLVNIATRDAVTLEECFRHAYLEIKDRTGKTVEGRFLKDV